MIQTLNGIWNYRIGKGEWTKKSIPFSSLCVGHSECKRSFDLEGISDTILLKFDGITYNAYVRLNGTYLGKLLPYCEYTFDVTEIVKEKGNSVSVEIEDIDAKFGPSEGWENYGGIIRDVSLIYKGKSYITDVFFNQSLVNSYKDAYYSVKVSTSSSMDYRVSLIYDNLVVDSFTSADEQTRFLKDVNIWSPDSPCLYTLTVELLENGKIEDKYTTSVGFKEFKCNKNHFLLNGESIFLKGVCRHEMYGKDSGHTVSYDDIYNDMRMIKETGCNFVRLVHYPHNKATVDIADKLGLLVCEEPGMWQADVNDKSLTEECLEVLKRTVLRDRNHPSIAFWLAFNECDFNEEFLKKAVQICRENDPHHLVSGANNMPFDDTKKYYTLCDLDFYTMHPYSETFEIAKKASEILCDRPLMFTEWGGYYVYDNPHLLTDFLFSMYDLYKSHKLAGTCLWYWAEINDYNRGGAACTDGVLKEALLDFDRTPNLIYDAFCNAIANMEKDHSIKEKYECKKHGEIKKSPIPCTKNHDYEHLIALAREPLNTRLAKTRKKQIDVGPVLQKEEFEGISKIPYLVTEDGIEFKGSVLTEEITILGMTAVNYGYPILGKMGEDAVLIEVKYEDGETDKYIAKNGVDITIYCSSVGSSRINPVAQNAKRIMEFSYDKNFEEYIINRLDIKTKAKPISKVILKSVNRNYNVLVYGVFA